MVNTRTNELEDLTTLVDRVKRARQFVSKDQLCVATQCGFASTAEGNLISEEMQWKKLDLVRQVAQVALDD